jgi:hypothetical protein
MKNRYKSIAEMLVALNGIMEKNQQFNYFFVD